MLPDSRDVHTHFQSHSESDVWRILFGKLTARPDKGVQGLSVHNGEVDKDISQTLTLDLSAECFPKALDLHFMPVHWLRICHYGHPAVKPQMTCRAKITCPIQLPWGVMATGARMKKSDRKRTSTVKKKKQSRREWARGMKWIYSKMKTQDRAIAQRGNKKKVSDAERRQEWWR